MKTYEIIINIEQEQEKETFTVWDGLSVVCSFVCLILTVLFCYLIAG